MQIKKSIFFIFFSVLIIFIRQGGFSQTKPLPEIVKKVEQSVVIISTYDKDGNLTSKGSGFFVNNKGNIITNRHVLVGADNADIKTYEDKVYPALKILSEDKEGDLLKILVDVSNSNTFPLSITNTFPQVGDQIIVIGSPLGLEGTVTNGIISAIRRVPTFGKIYQITAPISPGSSGSPVLNMNGKVIGVASFQIVEGQNLNFAIPAERISNLKYVESKSISEWNANLIEKQLLTASYWYERGHITQDTDLKIKYFTKVIELDDKYIDAYIERGMVYNIIGSWAKFDKLFEKDVKAAIADFTKAIELDPNSIYAYNNRSNAYKNLGNYEDAIKDITKTIELDPKSAAGYCNRGIIYKDLGNYRFAIRDLTRAINLDPKADLAFYYRGKVYYSQKDFYSAIKDFTDAIMLGEKAYLYCDRGFAYKALGIYEIAIQDFTKAIDLVSGEYSSLVYYLYRGETFYESGDYNTAIQDFTKVIVLDPRNKDAYYQRGMAYRGLNNYNAAIRDFTKTIEIAPNYSWAYYSRGQTYDILGYDKMVAEDYNMFLQYHHEKDDFTNWARKRIKDLGYILKY